MNTKEFWNTIENMFNLKELCNGKCREEWKNTQMTLKIKNVL